MEHETNTDTHHALIELSAGIVERYVANNQIQPDQVPELLENVFNRAKALQTGVAEGAQNAGKTNDILTPDHEPPVKPRNSIRKSDIVCLECGTSLKTLKRHLRTSHELDEDTYKQRWGLAPDTKLVAKNYSEQRSRMAREIGLGNPKR